jgi:hypothetical protein
MTSEQLISPARHRRHYSGEIRHQLTGGGVLRSVAYHIPDMMRTNPPSAIPNIKKPRKLSPIEL